jgi:NADH:ubiquinone oxidoreductase subunit E
MFKIKEEYGKTIMKYFPEENEELNENIERLNNELNKFSKQMRKQEMMYVLKMVYNENQYLIDLIIENLEDIKIGLLLDELDDGKRE